MKDRTRAWLGFTLTAALLLALVSWLTVVLVRLDADEEKTGDALGLLHGVPVTTKINVDQAGLPTSNGVVAYAGNIAATGGMAKLLKENEFATQFHEGEKANIHIQLVGNRVILVVIFDSRSSLGLVRLRVKKASEELNHIFEALLKKVQEPGTDSPFAEITDEDIDNLFND